jgi:hypothetical protein
MVDREIGAVQDREMINGEPGLIIYQVGDHGPLRGLWAVRGENGNGTEVLTPHQ